MGSQEGRGPQTDIHLPPSTFTGKEKPTFRVGVFIDIWSMGESVLQVTVNALMCKEGRNLLFTSHILMVTLQKPTTPYNKIKCTKTTYNQCWNFKQSMHGGQEPSKNWVVVPARQATQPDGTGSLESILGLLKSFKICAPYSSL